MTWDSRPPSTGIASLRDMDEDDSCDDGWKRERGLADLLVIQNPNCRPERLSTRLALTSQCSLVSFFPPHLVVSANRDGKRHGPAVNQTVAARALGWRSEVSAVNSTHGPARHKIAMNRRLNDVFSASESARERVMN